MHGKKSICGWLLTVVGVIVLMALVADAGDEAKKDKEEEVITFVQMQKKGMTTFLGREVMIKAVVVWDYASVKIPEDPTPMDEIKKKAGALNVSFDGEHFKDSKGKKYLHSIVAKGLKKVKDENGREGYAFNKLTLSNGGEEYIIKASLRLRAMFKKEYLKNPAFVKQCDNPRYWNQTFELDISDIQKPKKPKVRRQIGRDEPTPTKKRPGR